MTVSDLGDIVPKGGGAFSPDIRKRLADFSTRLADFKIPSFAQQSATAKLGRRQAGVSLEGAVERAEHWKPAPIAIVKTGASFWLESVREALASSIR